MNIDELNKQVKTGKLKNIYFFYGEEDYLLNKAITAIENKIITPGTEDFNKFVFEGKKIAIEDILGAIEQYPQMSEKKLVIVKNSGFLNQVTTKEYKLINEFSNNLPDYLCLIFTEDNFEKKKEKNVKFINEIGGVINFEFLPINRTEILLEEKISGYGKSILSKDVLYMINLCGQSLKRIFTELYKLINYVGDRKNITREDIDAVVTQTVEYRVFDMLDNLSLGKNIKAREQLNFLKNSKEQPTVILGQMIGKLSDTLMCKLLREDGLQSNEMLDYFDFKRPIFAVNKIINEGKRVNENDLIKLIKKGLSFDFKIKTGQIDGWTAVEIYFAEFAK